MGDANLSEALEKLSEAGVKLSEAGVKLGEAISTQVAVGERPNKEFLLKDIERANVYRLELIKIMLAMASGVLAFTVSFRPSIENPAGIWLMSVGWIALALSIVGGVFMLWMWEKFYISYRDYDNRGKKEDGKTYRKSITEWRRFWQFLQYLGLIVGVLSIGLFAAINIDRPPREPAKRAAIETRVAPPPAML